MIGCGPKALTPSSARLIIACTRAWLEIDRRRRAFAELAALATASMESPA